MFAVANMRFNCSDSGCNSGTVATTTHNSELMALLFSASLLSVEAISDLSQIWGIFGNIEKQQGNHARYVDILGRVGERERYKIFRAVWRSSVIVPACSSSAA